MNDFYIGNYKDWIKEEWIDYLLNNNGDLLPKKLKQSNNNYITDYQYDVIFENWDSSRVSLIGFSSHNFPFDISMPIKLENKNIRWNFIKLKSGMMIPLKTEEHLSFLNKSKIKYRMMLQDYCEGHVVLYNDNLIIDYKKGDLFVCNDPINSNGVVNIINDTCLVFEIIIEE